MEELLALWRGLDQVDVLALPGLDTVCVEWQESESLSRAALFSPAGWTATTSS